MSYSVSKLTTTDECDAVIAVANKDKDDLSYKKTSLQRRQASSEEKSVAIDADLAAANAELSALNTILPGLPDGDTKNDMLAKQKKLEYKKFLLEDRSKDYGAMTYLEREMEMTLIDKQIAEIDVFIAEVTAHQATL